MSIVQLFFNCFAKAGSIIAKPKATIKKGVGSEEQCPPPSPGFLYMVLIK